MNNRFTFPFLCLSGLLLLAIGGGIMLTPHAFYATNGIVLGDDPSLLSEVRAPGGLLLACAVFILVGALRRALRSQAVFVAVFVYGSFGLARFLGMILDGMPSSGLVVSTAIELIVAAIGLLILYRPGAAAVRSSRELATAPAGR